MGLPAATPALATPALATSPLANPFSSIDRAMGVQLLTIADAIADSPDPISTQHYLHLAHQAAQIFQQLHRTYTNRELAIAGPIKLTLLRIIEDFLQQILGIGLGQTIAHLSSGSDPN
jgi:hypothetical protein